MKKKSKNTWQKFKIVILLVVGIAVLSFGGYYASELKSERDAAASLLSGKLYTGIVHHIFFHSLIVYPEKAKADVAHADLYDSNMITVAQFKDILAKLYANNFVLIDSRSLYSVDADGTVHKKELLVPAGKKPLVLSLDDLNYYSSMKNGGFARKLVVQDGEIKTEIVTPSGVATTTSDGDVVPILDQFIKDHPDFSFNGAKGIIALTGYEGILGYRTQLTGAAGDSERTLVAPVVAALKKDGWIFASHSYTHELPFIAPSISSTTLAADIARWKKEVEPLIGPTDIFVGPFGQVFKEGDPRRTELVAAGFHVLYGVGLDEYRRYFPDHVVMNRIDIDGYRLKNNATWLHAALGI